MIHLAVIDPQRIGVRPGFVLNTMEFSTDDSHAKIPCELSGIIQNLEFVHRVSFFFSFVPSDRSAVTQDRQPSVVEGFSHIDAHNIAELPINEHCIPIQDINNRSIIHGSIDIRHLVVKRIRPPMILKRDIRSCGNPIFIGHRGSGANSYGSEIPENTIQSFNNAMTTPGIAGVELDVSLTLDRKLVVYHDIEKAHGGTKTPISCLSYASASSMDGMGSPILAEVLRSLIPSTAGIVIELKFVSNAFARKHPEYTKYTRGDLVEAVLDCLEANWEHVEPRWIALSSFDPDICLYLRKALPHTNALIVHNMWLGHESDKEDNTVDFTDARNRIWQHSFQQYDGLALEAAYILSDKYDIDKSDPSSGNRLVFSYGRGNLKKNNINEQYRRGVSAFFIDDMNLTNQFN